MGDLGHPESVGKISILLADKDESVRDAAEKALEKLKVPADRIVDWKEKAQRMSIDGFYQTQLAYEKVVSEKQSLKAQLDAQQQIKAELEKALKDREDALKRKEDMLTSLYEKERQLTDKANQLELSALQSEKYSRQLKALNKKVLTLNQKLKESAGTSSAKQLSEELNEALSNKEKLEKEVSASRQTEQVLKREMVALEKLAKKARIEAANAQQQVERMQNRESFLTKEVDNLRHRLKMGMEPVVLISNPKDGASIKEPSVLLTVFAVDDKGVVDISVMLNGQPISVDDGRGLSVVSAKPVEPERKLHFSKRLTLIEGQNQIQVTAVDTNGIKTIESITVSHVADRGQIFAAVIGINGYTNARDLKYAVNDAKKFKGYLRNHIDVPEDNILYLVNEQATKENILSALGTRLKRKAGKEDTVFIFFAGHGAVETDPLNPDGDGFEKYLLPYDADLNDLYATSISMDEIQKIFQRINSNRLVFIVDSCYSGASGGRTILASRSRANLSEKFYERISRGKGRVIISSSSANEVSQESDRYQHGLFTYFLLEGLKGAADFDQDELVTVDEVFSYISKTVPQASGQSQHPVKKGQFEGELIIGRVK